jgi:hypothetical protein
MEVVECRRTVVLLCGAGRLLRESVDRSSRSRASADIVEELATHPSRRTIDRLPE